ncbi:MAG: hypothetical protein ACOY3P_18840 [Planctomycetota bacterium]
MSGWKTASWAVALALAAAFASSGAAPAEAHDIWAIFRKPHFDGPANYPPTVNRFSHRPPGHAPFYATSVEPYPWLNNGLQVQTYNWGSFGAQYNPEVVRQHSYFNDYRQWSFRPGQ